MEASAYSRQSKLVETIEISLYLIGVSAFAREGDDFGARLCAEAMGTEAVHRALARFAQGELGNKEIGAPNDEGFENFDWPTLAKVRPVARGARHRLRGPRSSQPGKFYEYPGDPLGSRRRHARQPPQPGLTMEPWRGARAPRPRALTGVHGHSRTNPHRDKALPSRQGQAGEEGPELARK